jgi:hypothetical protein
MIRQKKIEKTSRSSLSHAIKVMNLATIVHQISKSSLKGQIGESTILKQKILSLRIF